MKRITILTAASLTNALFSLAPQPFSRRIVSASVQATVALLTAPLLKIADVEGNVLFACVALPESTTNRWTFSSTSDSAYLIVAAVSPVAGGVNFYPQPIPCDLIVPASNLFTVQLFGSAPGDTVGNLVLVTEDDYPLDWPD